eukprot:365177-Chlamydomonas_euryale.AAC.7
MEGCMDSCRRGCMSPGSGAAAAPAYCSSRAAGGTWAEPAAHVGTSRWALGVAVGTSRARGRAGGGAP